MVNRKLKKKQRNASKASKISNYQRYSPTLREVFGIIQVHPNAESSQFKAVSTVSPFFFFNGHALVRLGVFCTSQTQRNKMKYITSESATRYQNPNSALRVFRSLAGHWIEQTNRCSLIQNVSILGNGGTFDALDVFNSQWWPSLDSGENSKFSDFVTSDLKNSLRY